VIAFERATERPDNKKAIRLCKRNTFAGTGAERYVWKPHVSGMSPGVIAVIRRRRVGVVDIRVLSGRVRFVGRTAQHVFTGLASARHRPRTEPRSGLALANGRSEPEVLGLFQRFDDRKVDRVEPVASGRHRAGQ
jgi:hypothetical protein